MLSGSTTSFLARYSMPCAALGLAMLMLAGCGEKKPNSDSTENPATAAGPVDLIIEFDEEGEPVKQAVEIRGEMTVEGLMRTLESHEIEISGSGTTALVRSIDSVGMTADKGWLYEIDGRWAERGIGQTKVRPGSEIRWRYGDFANVKPPTGAGDSEAGVSGDPEPKDDASDK